MNCSAWMHSRNISLSSFCMASCSCLYDMIVAGLALDVAAAVAAVIMDGWLEIWWMPGDDVCCVNGDVDGDAANLENRSNKSDSN